MAFMERKEQVSGERVKSESKKGGLKMLTRIFNRMRGDQRGITGLETAIILIAFVVVASVFAYTVLSAGLFSTQKSQEAVYSGLEEAQTTMEMKGSVIALEGNTDKVSQITFTLANALRGEAINFEIPTNSGGLATAASTNVVVVSYVDQYQRVDDLAWTTTKLADADTDDLLEYGEKFQITIGGATDGTNDLEAALATDLAADMEFTIEVKPPAGAVLRFERTVPSVIDAVMNLN